MQAWKRRRSEPWGTGRHGRVAFVVARHHRRRIARREGADLEVNRVSADVVSLITVRARSLEAEHTLTCDFEALVMHPLRANGVTRS